MFQKSSEITKMLVCVLVGGAIFLSGGKAFAQRVPCLDAGFDISLIEDVLETVNTVVDMYNERVPQSEQMESPSFGDCYWSENFIPTMSFYPDYRYSSCALAENCTGRYAGYMANMMMGDSWFQANANVGRSQNMVRICAMEGETFEGSCMSR